MHPFNPKAGDIMKLQEELEDFKAYLNTERSALAQIPELLPFYALPFVGTPHVTYILNIDSSIFQAFILQRMG